MKEKQSEKIDVREEKVSFFCKCGEYNEETIVVSSGIGIVDTTCKKCKQRILFLYYSEKQEV